MKMIYSSAKYSLIVMCFILISGQAFTQNDSSENSKVKVSISLSFYQFENIYELKAKVTARINRKRKPVEGITFDIYNIADTSDILLGNMTTDENGETSSILERKVGYYVNDDGEKEFRLKFNGNDEYLQATKKIAIRDVIMELDFIVVDSVKTIVAKAFVPGYEGDKNPLEEEDVYFYVPGSFSLLSIGDAELEEGQSMINFPVTLPGDSLGNITIIARIEESDDFGSVEVQAVQNWATPRAPLVAEKRRGLGDTDAPLWMVYTLIVLMSAVWFHYMYIIFVVYQIKKDGKKIVSSESG